MSFARDVADRAIFMDQGRIVEQGAAKALFADPGGLARDSREVSAAIIRKNQPRRFTCVRGQERHFKRDKTA